jgi:hypothetical protein
MVHHFPVPLKFSSPASLASLHWSVPKPPLANPITPAFSSILQIFEKNQILCKEVGNPGVLGVADSRVHGYGPGICRQ